MKITMRQINAALSTLNLISGNEDIKASFNSWIDYMLKNKFQDFNIPDDNPIIKFIMDLSSLNKSLVDTQKRMGDGNDIINR